jgi:hypothetical protein
MALLATDDANRADGAIGASWSSSGSNPFVIKTNRFSNGALVNVASQYTAITLPADNWAQATVKLTTNMSWVGVALRYASGVQTYYAGGANPLDNGGSNNRRIWKNIAGARTSLASEAIDIAIDDVLRLELQGTTLTLFVNGNLRLTAVDSSIASGGAPAIIGRVSSGTDFVQLDDFSTGDFSGFTKIVGSRFSLAGRGGLVA